MDEIAALGKVIDGRREAADISVNNLAETTHIPRESLRRYLSSGDMRSLHLCRIALALDTTPSALWAEAEQVTA